MHRLQTELLECVIRYGFDSSLPLCAKIHCATASRGLFPLRTMIVCFTIWLIATQAMIFDQVKFDARAHLLEQATRSFGGPQVVVPDERPSNHPTGATVQRL